MRAERLFWGCTHPPADGAGFINPPTGAISALPPGRGPGAPNRPAAGPSARGAGRALPPLAIAIAAPVMGGWVRKRA